MYVCFLKPIIQWKKTVLASVDISMEAQVNYKSLDCKDSWAMKIILSGLKK